MLEIILLIIFLFSLFILGFIVKEKLPLISEKVKGEPFCLLDKIKNISWIKNFSFDKILQKVLSKIRVLFLKIENKTASCLEKLRENSKKRKLAEKEDNYWDKVKDLTKK